MIRTTLLLLASSLVTTHSHSKPLIESQSEFIPQECHIDDPLGICVSDHLVLLNPMPYPVNMYISCGVDNDEAVIQTGPHTRFSVDIERTVGSNKPCKIVKWNRVD